MNKIIKLLLPLALVATVFVGCVSNGETANTEEQISSQEMTTEKDTSVTDAPTKSNNVKLTFPLNQDGKAEINAEIFNVKPFTVSFSLPEGWSFREYKKANFPKGDMVFLYGNAWTEAVIFDDKNQCVGAIGYNLMQVYDGGDDNPTSIYSPLSLGSGYFFDTKEVYTPVKTTQDFISATTSVHYSANFAEDVLSSPTEKTNKGILACDKKRKVSIAMELEADCISSEQLTDIAESISFS